MAKFYKLKKPYDSIINEEGYPYSKELGILSRNTQFFNELLDGEIESKMKKYNVSYEMAKILHKYDISYEDAKNIEHEVKIEEDRQASNAANDADRYYANQAANDADTYYANQAANKADRRYANQAILNVLLAPEAQAILDILPESEEKDIEKKISDYFSNKGLNISEREIYLLAVNLDWKDPDENGNSLSDEELVEKAKKEVIEVEKFMFKLMSSNIIETEDKFKYKLNNFMEMAKVRYIMRTMIISFEDAEYINRVIKNWKNIPKDELLKMTFNGRVEETTQALQNDNIPVTRQTVEDIVSNTEKYGVKLDIPSETSKKQEEDELETFRKQKMQEVMLRGIYELYKSKNEAQKKKEALDEALRKELKKKKREEKLKKRRLRMMSNRKK
tara:strand:- start:3394 stop:4563 length:1170 start_codon:yes stop_codon:yes gene_type:complete